MSRENVRNGQFRELFTGPFEELAIPIERFDFALDRGSIRLEDPLPTEVYLRFSWMHSEPFDIIIEKLSS